MKKTILSSMILAMFSSPAFAETVEGVVVSISSKKSDRYVTALLDNGVEFKVLSENPINDGKQIQSLHTSFISKSKIRVDISDRFVHEIIVFRD